MTFYSFDFNFDFIVSRVLMIDRCKALDLRDVMILQILLKGAHSDELKRIKCVVQCAVIMAYHLILETSFLVDQRAMFSTIQFPEVANALLTDNQSPKFGSGNSSVPCNGEVATNGICDIDIPISNGFHAEETHNSNLELESNSTFTYEPYNPAIFAGLSSLSASLKKVMGDSFPLSASSYQSLSSYFGFNGHISEPVSCSTTPEAVDHCDMEAKGAFDEEKSLDVGQFQTSSECTEVPIEIKVDGGTSEDQIQNRDDISAVMDSQSILVLMSSRNALRGTICEQSHFSHIMFYKNFDVPLGKFLRNNLLNQVRHNLHLLRLFFYSYKVVTLKYMCMLSMISLYIWLPLF